MNAYITTHKVPEEVWDFIECSRVRDCWYGEDGNVCEITSVHAKLTGAQRITKKTGIFNKLKAVFGADKTTVEDIALADIPEMAGARMHVSSTPANEFADDLYADCISADADSATFKVGTSYERFVDPNKTLNSFFSAYHVSNGDFTWYIRKSESVVYKMDMALTSVEMSGLPLEEDWTQLTAEKLFTYGKERGVAVNDSVSTWIAYSDYAIKRFNISLEDSIGAGPVKLTHKSEVQDGAAESKAEEVPEESEGDATPADTGIKLKYIPVITKVDVPEAEESKAETPENTQETKQVIKRARSTKKIDSAEAADETQQASQQKKAGKTTGKPKIKQVKEIKIKKVSKPRHKKNSADSSDN